MSYEKNKKYAEKYLGEQERITIRVSKESGFKAEIIEHAENMGESVNQFIIRAIKQAIIRDTMPLPDKLPTTAYKI